MVKRGRSVSVMASRTDTDYRGGKTFVGSYTLVARQFGRIIVWMNAKILRFIEILHNSTLYVS